MANKHAAEKAMRQSARRHARNRIVRATARTQLKQAVAAIASNEPRTDQAVRKAIRALDLAAQKGIIKKNNAARRKSRLLKRLNRMHAAQK